MQTIREAMYVHVRAVVDLVCLFDRVCMHPRSPADSANVSNPIYETINSTGSLLYNEWNKIIIRLSMYRSHFTCIPAQYS